MGREFNRKGNKDFNFTKPDDSKKGKKKDIDKEYIKSYAPSGKFKSDTNFLKDKKSKASFKENKGFEKETYSGGEGTQPSKEFKSERSGGFKNDKPFDNKKQRPSKGDNKPSFKRFKDDSKPSDFGTSKKRGSIVEEENTVSERGRKSFLKSENPPKTRGFVKSTSSRKPSSAEELFDKQDVPYKKKLGSFDEKGKAPINAKPFGSRPKSKENKEIKSRDYPKTNKMREDLSQLIEKTRYRDKPGFVRKSDGLVPKDINIKDVEFNSERLPLKSTSGRSFNKPGATLKKNFTSSKSKSKSKPQRETDDGMVRLNKYLSNAGICSRREADDLIASGVVQVNGKNITEMGFRVKQTDIVKYGGQTLKKERLVYLILNKPKDYITTADDPQERKTVLELVQGACKERIYPVGRLDRATTGLLMFTNDGDLTKKLTHPRYGVRKIYHVELDKPLKRTDLDKIAEGIELEEGAIKVDEVSYVGDGLDKTQVGVEIHSGKNRIVRRIFEHFGYNVRKLDRVLFGSLTKKDLPRGRWRILTDAEVGMLKMISSE